MRTGSMCGMEPSVGVLGPRFLRTRHALWTVAVVLMVTSCSSTGVKSSTMTSSSGPGTRLTVPHQDFSGFVDTVALRSTLKGIDVFDTEACPWIENHVLLVFSTDASVDASGPVLISKDLRIAVGGYFASGPLVPLQGGFVCGGKHWGQAAQLPTAPKSWG